jgi:hypothetical protein
VIIIDAANVAARLLILRIRRARLARRRAAVAAKKAAADAWRADIAQGWAKVRRCEAELADAQSPAERRTIVLKWFPEFAE